MGDDGSWIKLAEEKILIDHSLDHHSLMWELGIYLLLSLFVYLLSRSLRD